MDRTKQYSQFTLPKEGMGSVGWSHTMTTCTNSKGSKLITLHTGVDMRFIPAALFWWKSSNWLKVNAMKWILIIIPSHYPRVYYQNRSVIITDMSFFIIRQICKHLLLTDQNAGEVEKEK